MCAGNYTETPTLTEEEKKKIKKDGNRPSERKNPHPAGSRR